MLRVQRIDAVHDHTESSHGPTADGSTLECFCFEQGLGGGGAAVGGHEEFKQLLAAFVVEWELPEEELVPVDEIAPPQGIQLDMRKHAVHRGAGVVRDKPHGRVVALQCDGAFFVQLAQVYSHLCGEENANLLLQRFCSFLIDGIELLCNVFIPSPICHLVTAKAQVILHTPHILERDLVSSSSNSEF